MESALRKPSEKYNLLKFGYGKPIPSFRGIRADVLYTSDYKANERTIKQIASNRDLPEEVVRQAIDWCIENDDLITKILTKERREAV